MFTIRIMLKAATDHNIYSCSFQVLVGMTLLLLVMAIVSNWIKFLDLQELLVKFRLVHILCVFFEHVVLLELICQDYSKISALFGKIEM